LAVNADRIFLAGTVKIKVLFSSPVYDLLLHKEMKTFSRHEEAQRV
jgi:hypothetical protein